MTFDNTLAKKPSTSQLLAISYACAELTWSEEAWPVIRCGWRATPQVPGAEHIVRLEGMWP